MKTQHENQSSSCTHNDIHVPVIEKELSVEYASVVKALERIETELRIEQFPNLSERASIVIDNNTRESHSKDKDCDSNNNQDSDKHDGNGSNNHSSTNSKQAIIQDDGKIASLRNFNLRDCDFSISLIETQYHTQLTTLDLSHNEIKDIPGLSNLINLQILNLERGWFNTLPTEIGSLKHLHTLIASRNFLRPNVKSLQIEQLKTLPLLTYIDLTYNQKCCTIQHQHFIQSQLPQIQQVKLTLWTDIKSIPGSYIGASASERDPKLLRSQLEPWGTLQLRRRLVQDFNQIPTDATEVDRAGVMARLLDCYKKEGFMEEKTGIDQRKRVYVEGQSVPQSIIDDLLIELRSWTKETGLDNKNRERPSINARNYMILCRPEENNNNCIINNNNNNNNERKRSRAGIRKAKKISKYRNIWDHAIKALQHVNPVFANQCTEIAVTFGFQGSPHIDKQNSGPFYGLSLGNFKSGQGGKF